jgi:hypothetical protein
MKSHVNFPMDESEEGLLDVNSLSPVHFGRVTRVRGWVSAVSEQSFTIRSTAPRSCAELLVRCGDNVPPEVQYCVMVMVKGLYEKRKVGR